MYQARTTAIIIKGKLLKLSAGVSRRGCVGFNSHQQGVKGLQGAGKLSIAYVVFKFFTLHTPTSCGIGIFLVIFG